MVEVFCMFRIFTSLVLTWHQMIKVIMFTIKNHYQGHVKQNNNQNKYYSNSLSHISECNKEGEKRICTLI